MLYLEKNYEKMDLGMSQNAKSNAADNRCGVNAILEFVDDTLAKFRADHGYDSSRRRKRYPSLGYKVSQEI